MQLQRLAQNRNFPRQIGSRRQIRADCPHRERHRHPGPHKMSPSYH